MGGGSVGLRSRTFGVAWLALLSCNAQPLPLDPADAGESDRVVPVDAGDVRCVGDSSRGFVPTDDPSVFEMRPGDRSIGCVRYLPTLTLTRGDLDVWVLRYTLNICNECQSIRLLRTLTNSETLRDERPYEYAMGADIWLGPDQAPWLRPVLYDADGNSLVSRCPGRCPTSSLPFLHNIEVSPGEQVALWLDFTPPVNGSPAVDWFDESEYGRDMTLEYWNSPVDYTSSSFTVGIPIPELHSVEQGPMVPAHLILCESAGLLPSPMCRRDYEPSAWTPEQVPMVVVDDVSLPDAFTATLR